MSYKLYTCYFSGLGQMAQRAVSLCIQQPPGFRLPVAGELAPPVGMYWKFMRGGMSRERFSQLYRMRFGVLLPLDIAARYDGMVLTAWEGYEDRARTVLKFSHRHLVAEWLRQNGVEVEELPPAKRKRRVL